MRSSPARACGEGRVALVHRAGAGEAGAGNGKKVIVETASGYIGPIGSDPVLPVSDAQGIRGFGF
jgi:hypothetical protein